MENTKQQEEQEQEQEVKQVKEEQEEMKEEIHANNNNNNNKEEKLILSEDGISLSGILSFINSLGGRQTFENLTIKEVIDNFIKPSTLSSNKSYCELLKHQNQNQNESENKIIKKANVYFSNSHNDIFLDHVDFLTTICQNQNNQNQKITFIWWDIFTVNQHQNYKQITVDSWSSFKSIIESIKYTIIFVNSWNSNFLKEVWCQLEVYSTVETNSILDIFVTNQFKSQIIQSFIRNPTSELQRLSTIFNLLKIKQSNDPIEKSIYKLISSSSSSSSSSSLSKGIFHFNQINSSTLTNYIINIIEEDFKQHPQDKRYYNTLGVLYFNQQNYEKAEINCKISYEFACNLLGSNHRDTLNRLNQLALVYLERKNYEESIELFTKCYETRKEVLKYDHPDTLDSMFNLANAYFQQLYQNNNNNNNNNLVDDDNIDIDKIIDNQNENNNKIINNKIINNNNKIKIESLLKKCYKLRSQVLGKDHLDTIKSTHLLGLYYYNEKDYDEAKTFLKESTKLFYTVVGIENDLTIQSLNLLSLVYEKKELYSMAINHLTEIHQYTEELYGEKNEFSLNNLYRMAKLYLQIDIQKSQFCIQQYYQKCFNAFGLANLFTTKAVYLIGKLMIETKDYNQANQTFRTTLTLLRDFTSELSKESLDCLNDVGISYFYLKDYEKCKEMLEMYESLIETKLSSLNSNSKSNSKLSYLSINPITSLSNLKYQIKNSLKMKDYELTNRLNEKYYNICIAKYGKKHQETIESVRIFVEMNEETNNYKKLIKYLKILLEIKEEIYGSIHSETIGVKYELSQAYKKNNQGKKAEELMKTMISFSMSLTEQQQQEQEQEQEQQEQQQEQSLSEEEIEGKKEEVVNEEMREIEDIKQEQQKKEEKKEGEEELRRVESG